MDRRLMLFGGIGLAAAGALSAGLIVFGPTVGTLDGGQLDAGPVAIIGPPAYSSGASVLWFVKDDATGAHATVAKQCATAAAWLCDFYDTMGTRHVIATTPDGGLQPVIGGAVSAIVQAPDGGWVAQ